MRQLFLEKGLIKIRQVCEPLLDEDMILVSVHYSCISPGTEGSTISNAQQSIFTNLYGKLQKLLTALSTNGVEGTRALIRERLSGNTFALGYSCSGMVIGVGKKVTRFRVGDLVACAGAGYANHADLVVIPENLAVLIHNPEMLAPASLTTLGAIALQGIRRAQLQIGETVCVIGLGILGQLSIQFAKKAGCHVIAIDLINARLELAHSLGADRVLHAQESNVEKEIKYITAHQGADVTIITAGSESNAIVQQAMVLTRKKGRVVLVGDVGLHLEREPFYQKEIDFLMSCSYGPGRYDALYEKKGIDYPYAYVRWTENRNMQFVVQMIEQKDLNVEKLMSQTLPIEQAQEAYTLLDRKEALIVVLSYNKKDTLYASTIAASEQKKEITDFEFNPARKGQLRLGVIGAGGFAKVKLIPIISRIKGVKINAIVDVNIANSITLSKVYGAAKALSHDKALFDEDLVDVVLIASPHKFHSQQALDALNNNKAVFLEKPMVTDFDQLKQFKDFFERNKNNNVPFCVDYNRSFAPFIQKIKKVIVSRNSPLIVTYRMNAGFIPKEHWIQTEIGAGRIIGEACHIIDLFHFLTDADMVAVSVETIRPQSDALLMTDNFSAQCSFSDGSVCTLIYTSLGHGQLGKERMELFFDSKSIVMDDYKILQGFGLSRALNEKVLVPEKGHEEILKQFFASIQQTGSAQPINWSRLEKVAYVTLLIDQLACQSGGVHEIQKGA